MSRQMCPEKSEPTPCECPVGKCVLAEMRGMAQPGGKARALEAYKQELRTEQERRSQGADPQDLPFRLQRIGIPAEAIVALRGKPEDSLAMLAAKRFTQAPKEAGLRLLLLLGAPGVGKSLAAAWVVREEARRYDWSGQASGGVHVEPIQFVRAGELTRVDGYDRADTQRLEGMAKCRLLVLDDVGDEGGPVARGALVETILRREANGKRTVITTNLTKERFMDLYGAPLADRLRTRGITPDLTKDKSRRRRVA